MKKKLVVFSGAGISAESGVKTFRDTNGLWENEKVEDVASPEGFKRDPKKVLDFYNARRRQLKEVQPNKAHQIIAELEHYFDVEIITQNVDELHERAGSTKVTHLHGELLKVREIYSNSNSIFWDKDLNPGDVSENGIQLRPDIVWFGEEVTEMDHAIQIAEKADILLVIGTSLQVYPAAGLVNLVPENCEIFLIDPHLENNLVKNENFFKCSAAEGMKKLRDIILSEYI